MLEENGKAWILGKILLQSVGFTKNRAAAGL